MERKRKTDKWTGFIKEYTAPILTIVSFFCGAIIWVHTMTGIPARMSDAEKDIKDLQALNAIPPRVDKLEDDVEAIKKSLTTYGVKQDIMLDDIKEMKNFIIGKHTR